MKVVILAGGCGTRILEESRHTPKPMITIGGHPLIWHVMKIYEHYGFKDFIICVGYKSAVIKEYFANYYRNHSKHIYIDLNTSSIQSDLYSGENWTIHLVDSGINVGTAQRLLSVKAYLDPDESFCLTYADGLGNIDISKLVTVHETNPCVVTLTCVQQPHKFGQIELEEYYVKDFIEKPNQLVNAGFYVCKPELFSFIKKSDFSFENDCLPLIAKNGQLTAYTHQGFWHPMDMLRDKIQLESLYEKNEAPWVLWK